MLCARRQALDGAVAVMSTSDDVKNGRHLRALAAQPRRFDQVQYTIREPKPGEDAALMPDAHKLHMNPSTAANVRDVPESRRYHYSTLRAIGTVLCPAMFEALR